MAVVQIKKAYPGLQSLVGRIVNALDAEEPLPETVELKVTETIKDPFA